MCRYRPRVPSARAELTARLGGDELARMQRQARRQRSIGGPYPAIPEHAHRPRLHLRPLVAVLCIVLCAGLAAASSRGAPRHRAVYSVAGLHTHLAMEPRCWLGRALLVQGAAVPDACAEAAGTPVLCAPPQGYLTDPCPTLAVESLPLVSARPDPWLAVARRLPLVGSIAPPPQVVHWGRVAVYRIQLRALPDAFGGSAAYEALLLDAAPEAG